MAVNLLDAMQTGTHRIRQWQQSLPSSVADLHSYTSTDGDCIIFNMWASANVTGTFSMALGTNTYNRIFLGVKRNNVASSDPTYNAWRFYNLKVWPHNPLHLVTQDNRWPVGVTQDGTITNSYTIRGYTTGPYAVNLYWFEEQYKT